ncbi:sugar nucleotide-binding protein [Larsenimonas suaedae]|uniref:Sugar nucleotide-binding protein n=1 Tax=Larsenimonas suaedae TaxID=1851019 RepID=A0ABU1GYS1_9GAMM|nr:sugar nucleotide-binding protein [Larsenimonas suaedae]MCM2973670.1 NAD(P)-dependent oxidoreductase [Larsenimonas suaedae]MDR5897196.1 sugar nucleotide-binding protein [Larsenimonas suaedae]
MSIETYDPATPDDLGWSQPDIDAIVVPPLSHPASAEPARVFDHAAMVEHVFDHCARHDLPLVWCVSDQMFEAGGDEPIKECLIPEPIDSGLRRLVKTGSMIRARKAKHIILRVGPLFGIEGEDAWLPNIIDTLLAQKTISAPQDVVVGPTSVEALSMALTGILLQINYGATHWGAYHLAGIEPVTPFAFSSMVRTQLDTLLSGQGLERPLGDVRALSHHHDQPMRRVLNCQRLLETYGVHQRPWRVELERLLKHWCEQAQAGEVNL